jgi:hypothetical protein
VNWIGLLRHWPAVLVASPGVVASLWVFDHSGQTEGAGWYVLTCGLLLTAALALSV